MASDNLQAALKRVRTIVTFTQGTQLPDVALHQTLVVARTFDDVIKRCQKVAVFRGGRRELCDHVAFPLSPA
jgi:hypothetical protein